MVLEPGILENLSDLLEGKGDGSIVDSVDIGSENDEIRGNDLVLVLMNVDAPLQIEGGGGTSVSGERSGSHTSGSTNRRALVVEGVLLVVGVAEVAAEYVDDVGFLLILAAHLEGWCWRK